MITSARGIRARAIAEHILGVTIALARQLPVAIRAQVAHRWAQDELEGPAAAPRTVRPADFASAPEKGFGRGGLPQAAMTTSSEAARAAVRGSKPTAHNLFMAPANTARIAIVQHPPVLLDRDATLARGTELVAEAAKGGARD